MNALGDQGVCIEKPGRFSCNGVNFCVIFDLLSALEIRTKKLRAKVAPNSEKLGATLKSWGPS